MRQTTPPSMSWVELRQQIIDNYSFLSASDSSDTKLSIISSVDGKGLWHARIIHSTRARRDEGLSGSGPTEWLAMCDLHLRTCQAVHHYFEANGAAYPRAFDSDEESDAEDDGDQDADVDPDDVSVWNDGSPDLPDESDDEEILPAGVNETMRPSAQPLPRGCIGLARASVSAVSRIDRAAAGGIQDHAREPMASMKQGLFPEQLVRTQESQGRAFDEVGPQAFGSHQTRATNDNTIAARTATPPLPPPAQLVVEARAPTSSYHVRLVISMANTDAPSESTPAYQMVTTIARPSLHALLGAAVGYIRTMPAPDVPDETPTLRSRVKRVQMGDSMWDMGGYRCDDMSIFFATGPNGPTLPLFEIEVEDATVLAAALAKTGSPALTSLDWLACRRASFRGVSVSGDGPHVVRTPSSDGPSREEDENSAQCMAG
ncbi:hypothetical protein B0T11DRAFT_340123 [Plectosphaerella cucumerina]|uniref:Uncharacterized protein n=1 Tax=Plectosphaerella cucumerina TaxID=40658 RepID=A0A8K0X4B8_9PEZI|nr:hypothetical protein B0T11DRAFT_340123 [Plectosphaerella cucumerina]